jgi:hypothetical protein
MTYDVHPTPVSLIQYFSGVDHTKHRVLLVLVGDSQYYAADILEEWQDAVLFVPEVPGVSGPPQPLTEPWLVFKDRIEAVKITPRPPPRRGREDD